MPFFDPMITMVRRAAIIIQMEDGRTFWIGGLVRDPTSEVTIESFREVPPMVGRHPPHDFFPYPSRSGWNIEAHLKDVEGVLQWREGMPTEEELHPREQIEEVEGIIREVELQKRLSTGETDTP